MVVRIVFPKPLQFTRIRLLILVSATILFVRIPASLILIHQPEQQHINGVLGMQLQVQQQIQHILIQYQILIQPNSLHLLHSDVWIPHNY